MSLQDAARLVRDPAVLLGEAIGLLRELETNLPGAHRGGRYEAADMLTQLRAYSRQVLAESTVAGVLERALEQFVHLGLACRCFVGIRDSAGAPVERFACANLVDEHRLELRGIARTALARVVAWQEPLFLPDVMLDPQLGADVQTYGVNVGGMVALPLVVDGDAIGGIYLDRMPGDARYSDGDLELTRYLAELLARCLAMALREEARARREEHLASLFTLARNIGAGVDLEGMLDHVATSTIQITGAERAFILLVDGDQITFGVGRDANAALPASTLKQLSHSVCQKVLETQTPVCVFDTGADTEFGLKRSVVNLQLQGIVAVPLFGRAGLSGVLYIDSKTKVLAGLRREMTVLTAIASVAGLMVDNARLFHRATLDQTTGLFSRSLLMIRLEEEVSRARRYKRPFSLITVDLDESRGGEAGKAAIKRVAQVVRNQLRSGIDFPALYAPDRVAMILPETDAEGALVVAERIRERVAGSEASGLTVSIGIAGFPAAAGSMHGLIDAVERSLDAARAQGRNRTIVAPAL